ncbi:hypothetical protein F383_26607 [Gossypium arboreum]|uniref:Uncharacterized protein n=1 Tax=Gossypium arboreum TaxID=29729 RepID=A0A0B0P5J3_GOSAR|nr:hypothetical protein F383_26607 [Gossypium arboreum]
MLLILYFHVLYLGEHRRVKRARNGPKTEKMDQHGKLTRPRLPHTCRPHVRAYSTALTMV